MDMRKIIFSLVMVMVSLCASAQLPRVFLGFTLGETSKEQVLEKLRKKGAEIKEDGSVMIKKQKYDKVTWDNVRLEFNDNKLFKVLFCVDSSLHSSSSLDAIFEKAGSTLRIPYGDYVIENETNRVTVGDPFCYGELTNVTDSNGRRVHLAFYDRQKYTE